MARKSATQSASTGPLQRVTSAVKKLFSRGRSESPEGESRTVEPQARTAAAGDATPQTARTTRRQTDIPMDVLDRTYTPPLTSSKASFRSDGSDHERDQEFAYGVADDRWNDEDRYTNKSGDPRIGTRGRTYDSAEAEIDSRK